MAYQGNLPFLNVHTVALPTEGFWNHNYSPWST